MTKRIATVMGAFLLVLGLAAFTGSALAGNGQASGNVKTDAAATAPGNSANAPGQQKKGAVGARASTQARGGGSADQNVGIAAGVKPTNASAKGSTCTTGGGTGSSATCKATGVAAANAQSAGKADASKRYGSGTTAAQIASSRGAPAGTTIYGPGNSQPHKVSNCVHPAKNNNGGGVDVHAVKSFSSAQCTSSTGTTVRTTTSNSTTLGATVATTGKVSTAHGNASQGGVLGATASKSQPAGGVLGAIESVGQGALPFTGLPLLAAVLFAAALIGLGLALRRHSRATV